MPGDENLHVTVTVSGSLRPYKCLGIAALGAAFHPAEPHQPIEHLRVEPVLRGLARKRREEPVDLVLASSALTGT